MDEKQNNIPVESMNLYQKISGIREIADVVKKSASGYSYKYTPEDEILAYVKAGMSKYNVTIFPRVKYDTFNLSPVAKQKYDKINKAMYTDSNAEYLVQANVEFVIVNNDNTNETLVVPWVIVASAGDPAQAFGSALTYGNRYFLLKFFGVATTEDDPDAWLQKKKDAEAKDELEAAKAVVAKIDELVKANISATNRTEFTQALVKSKLIIVDGKASANYLAIKTLSAANETFKFVQQYFNKPVAAKEE